MKRYLIALIVLLFAATAYPQAMMPNAKVQLFDNNGRVCAGCKLYAFYAGTSTAKDTYSDFALSTPNANPVILDSAGRATIYLSAGNYKFRLDSAADVTIWTQDNTTNPNMTSEVFVDDYGCMGDGSTDDTTCFNDALASNRRILLGVNKTYLVGNITESSLSNVEIIGNPSSEIKLKDNEDDHVFDITSCTDIVFDGIIINGNKANQTTTYGTDTRYGIYLNSCSNVRIVNSEINDTAGGAVRGADSSFVTIDNLTGTGFGCRPIYIASSATGSDISDITVKNSYIDWSTQDATVGDLPILIVAGYLDTYTNDHIRILNNHFIQKSSGTTGNLISCINTGGGIDTQVIGNHCVNGGMGISFAYGTDGLIADNIIDVDSSSTIAGSFGYGVEIAHGSARTRVVNTNVDGGGHLNACYQSQADNDDVMVEGGYCINVATVAYRSSATAIVGLNNNIILKPGYWEGGTTAVIELQDVIDFSIEGGILDADSASPFFVKLVGETDKGSIVGVKAINPDTATEFVRLQQDTGTITDININGNDVPLLDALDDYLNDGAAGATFSTGIRYLNNLYGPDIYDYANGSAEINVLKNGATGDGSTNDATALQACITYAATVGAPVILPYGTYVTASNLTLYENSDIRGGSIPSHREVTRKTTKIVPSSAVTKVFYADELRGFNIENIEIDMTNAPAATDVRGISIEGSWGYTVSNVMIHSLSDDAHTGVYIAGDTNGPYWGTLEHVYVYGNGTYTGATRNKDGNGIGFELVGASGKGVNNLTMIDCQALDLAYGIDGDYLGSVVVITPQIENIQYDGVEVTNSTANVKPLILGGEISHCGAAAGYCVSGDVVVKETSISNGFDGNVDSSVARDQYVTNSTNKHLTFSTEIKAEVTDIDVSQVSTSGTGEDDLGSWSMDQDYDHEWHGFRLQAAGVKAGANDTKTLKFYIGSTSVTFHAANNDTQDWSFKALVLLSGGAAQRIIWEGGRTASFNVSQYDVFTEDNTAGALTVKITGECVNAGDTISQWMWLVESF